jgi:acetylornithine deacetylase
VALDVVQLLRQLVAIASVNPMGRDPRHCSTDDFYETRVTAYLESLFQQLRLPYLRQTVHPGRDNIFARLDGDTPYTVLFAAHQDTVPVEGMTVAPFCADVRDGRLYGRGACDVKGGMAAMLAALSRLADHRPTGRPTLLLCCTVNEEYGFSGAKAAAELLRQPDGDFIKRRPDVAIIAEPTDLNVVVAHRGVVRWSCHTLGRAAHSSQPEAGDNAIYKMARVLQTLESYQRALAASGDPHPLCGRGTLSVGTIHGGISANVVPDRCTIEIERRLSPGEMADTAYRQVIDYVGARAELNSTIVHESPHMIAPAFADDVNGPLAADLAAITRSIAGRSSQLGAPYATDAAFFATAGIPSVVYGPGNLAQAHTVDEWISIDQLQQAVDVLYHFARSRQTV